MLRKWNDIVPTYLEATKKSLGNIPNVKFFTVDPYFGGIFKVERPKEAKNSTLAFLDIKGGSGWSKNCGLQNRVGAGEL